MSMISLTNENLLGLHVQVRSGTSGAVRYVEEDAFRDAEEGWWSGIVRGVGVRVQEVTENSHYDGARPFPLSSPRVRTHTEMVLVVEADRTRRLRLAALEDCVVLDEDREAEGA